MHGDSLAFQAAKNPLQEAPARGRDLRHRPAGEARRFEFAGAIGFGVGVKAGHDGCGGFDRAFLVAKFEGR
jgi:hypothetical protein